MARSLEEVRIVGVEGEPGNLILDCLCDCAETTRVTLAGVGRPDAKPVQEFAYTCDGCGTAHWMTVDIARGQT